MSRGLGDVYKRQDPPAGDTAFVREGAPDGRTGDGGVAPVLLKKLQRNPKAIHNCLNVNSLRFTYGDCLHRI